MSKTRCSVLIAGTLQVAVLMFSFVTTVTVTATEKTQTSNFRKPANNDDLRYWLENMIWHHRRCEEEVRHSSRQPP